MRTLIAVSLAALAAVALGAGAPAASADKEVKPAHACMRAGPANFYSSNDKQGVVATRDGRAYAVDLRGVCINISKSWGVGVQVSRPGAMDLCDNHDGALVYADNNLNRSCRVDSIRRLSDDEAKPYLSGGPGKG